MISPQHTSKQQLLAIQNRENTQQFTLEEIDFVVPPKTLPVMTLPNGRKINTEVQVFAKTGTPYVGVQTYGYLRQNLADVFGTTVPFVKFPPAPTAFQVMALVFMKYNLGVLNPAEVVTALIPPKQKGVNRQVVLTLTNNHFTFFGSIVVADRQELPELIQVTDLGQLPYPSPDTTKIQGPVYSYPYSYRDYDYLVNFSGTDVPTARLAEMLTLATRNDWVCLNSAGLNWNIGGGKILYNGTTTSATMYRVNLNYTNVLVLQLSAVNCVNVGGYLVLHYNHPLGA